MKKRSVKREKVHPAEIKLAALRALTATIAQPAAVNLQETDVLHARLFTMLAAGKDAEDISIELDVPIDTLIPVLWRIAQAAA